MSVRSHEVFRVKGKLEGPVEKLATQLEDLRNTLRTVDDAKDQLRPELKKATGDVSTLLRSRGTRVEPLYEFPRVLTAILENPKIGALIFGANGERLLNNSRAEELLGKLLQWKECGGKGEHKKNDGAGFFKKDGGEAIAHEDLPWSLQTCKKDTAESECEIFVRRSSKNDDFVWLRVTVTPLTSSQPGLPPGGAVAFLADITEHVNVVNELSNICRDTEKRLDEFSQGLNELSLLAEKLQAIKKHEEPAEEKNLTPAQPAKSEQDKKMGEGLTVLVVDDVAVNQKLLKLQLERLGFRVEVAGDGKEAFEKVKNHDFDIVLMDCDMPRVDGYEATEMIRAIHDNDKKSQVPIVAVTAYDREGDKEKCLASGMNDYITKGSAEGLLREMLAKWLKIDSQWTDTDDLSHTAKARTILFEDGAAVDYKELRRIYGDQEADEIVKLFLGVTGTFIECLDLAVASKDAESVSHFAYSIKGPLSSLKLRALADLASRLPQQAAKHKWKEAKKSYEELVSLYKPVKEQLEKEFKG